MKPLIVAVVWCLCACKSADVEVHGAELHANLEEKLEGGAPLTPATQSINRYQSVLDELSVADLDYDAARARLRAVFRRPLACGARSKLTPPLPCDAALTLDNLDAHFLVPTLAYAHGHSLDAFDKLVLMLAEYSRSGVEVALAGDNRRYGFASARGLFDDAEEYAFVDGKVAPNPRARPKRVSLVNNCLFPGLWEVNAQDSVGEMWHAWFTLEQSRYFALLRNLNGLSDSDAVLRGALEYQKQIPEVPLALDRLRTQGDALGVADVRPALDKAIASYSTQDSRRKVQRKFYRIERVQPNKARIEIQPLTQADLAPNDVFVFHSFIPPGIYTHKTPRDVAWEPLWSRAELSLVTPLTRFSGAGPYEYKDGALEVRLVSVDGKRAIIFGNLPIDLLVPTEDFDIPGFGVGVLRASEPVEKRYLYLKDGPAPVYAFMAHKGDDGRWYVSNNHEEGLEQIYLRPVLSENSVKLRVTLVAYERIVDLLELELTAPEPLAARLRQAAARYQRPLWRSFADTNLF